MVCGAPLASGEASVMRVVHQVAGSVLPCAWRNDGSAGHLATTGRRAALLYPDWATGIDGLQLPARDCHHRAGFEPATTAGYTVRCS